MKSTLIPLVLLVFTIVGCTNKFDTLQEEKNSYNLSTEEQLSDHKYTNQIDAFYINGTTGYFKGKNDTQIYYKTFIQSAESSPAILISSGRSEAAIKYKELIYDLFQNGFSVYIHDHRGQGLSGRLTDDPKIGHIDTFQFYIDDMKYFYDNILEKSNHQKKYVLTHSMGGAIGMSYLEQYPNDFNAAAFASPMLGFATTICTAVNYLTDDKIKYAIGQEKFILNKTPFEKNKLTGSKIRYNRILTAYKNEPNAIIDGPSYQWLYKSCQQFKYIYENISSIKTPFILFTSENEHVVNKNAHQKFIKKAIELNKTCIAFNVTNAQHELFIEKDEQRIETLNQTFRFFQKY